MKRLIVAMSVLIAALGGCRQSDHVSLLAPVKFLTANSAPEGDGHKQKLGIEDYISWVEDEENGLQVNRKVGDFGFAVQHQPIPYMILQNAGKEKISQKELEKEVKEQEGLQYYTFSIRSVDGKDVLNNSFNITYQERLEYFSFGIDKDLSLVEGEDTLQCVMHHYERNYNISPEVRITVAFEQKASERNLNHTDKTFIFSDHVLGTGTVKMKIKASDIERIPELNIQ